MNATLHPREASLRQSIEQAVYDFNRMPLNQTTIADRARMESILIPELKLAYKEVTGIDYQERKERKK